MSDSPLPIPSGYFCHTSCAIGKGRQPQQYDCPLSLFLSLSLNRRGRTRLPQFHPRGPIFIDHPRRHRSVHFLFSRVLYPRSLKKKEKKRQTPSFRCIAKTAVLPRAILLARGRVSRDENSPRDSLFLGSSCRSGMSHPGMEENSAKLGNITSAWYEFKREINLTGKKTSRRLFRHFYKSSLSRWRKLLVELNSMKTDWTHALYNRCPSHRFDSWLGNIILTCNRKKRGNSIKIIKTFFSCKSSSLVFPSTTNRFDLSIKDATRDDNALWRLRRRIITR